MCLTEPIAFNGLICVQKLRQRIFGVPFWQDNISFPIPLSVVELVGLVFRGFEPLLPGSAHRRAARDLDPVDALRDGDGFPQSDCEVLGFLVSIVVNGFDAETGEIPVPLFRKSGHNPINSVKYQISCRETCLHCQSGIAEENYPDHEHKSGDETDNAISPGFDIVTTFFRMPVQFTRRVLVAFDDKKNAVRILDHYV